MSASNRNIVKKNTLLTVHYNNRTFVVKSFNYDSNVNYVSINEMYELGYKVMILEPALVNEIESKKQNYLKSHLLESFNNSRLF